jgi:hypothetical protein
MNTMADIKSKSKTTTLRPSFPQRVYNVLKLCEDNHQEHIASWVNDGTAFKVHGIEQFERELLPKYFNTQKYASFTRALCSYGFDCVRTGRQTGICKLKTDVIVFELQLPQANSNRFHQTRTLISIATTPRLRL